VSAFTKRLAAAHLRKCSKIITSCQERNETNQIADMFGDGEAMKATRDQKISLLFFLGFIIAMICSTCWILPNCVRSGSTGRWVLSLLTLQQT